MSLNPDSRIIRMADGFATSMTAGSPIKGRPFGWIGTSLALYADESDAWDMWVEMAASEGDDIGDDVFEEAFGTPSQIPVLLWIEVRSGFALTTFLATARTFIEQSSPGMTIWETREHEGEPYVSVAPSDRGMTGIDDPDFAIYYANTGRELMVTLNEATMHRALARSKSRMAAAKATTVEAKAPDDAPKPWLGENVCFEASNRLIDYFLQTTTPALRDEFQKRSWSNLPILNVWHALLPGGDPVDAHERIWGERLICPGGGKYVWNEEWQTMESSVYGHPGQPKEGPAYPSSWSQWQSGRFGMTFEHDGLRARTQLDRKP
jgi:hypothetical protein